MGCTTSRKAGPPILGWDDSNYPRIYEAFEKIFDNTIKWNLLGKDKTLKA